MASRIQNNEMNSRTMWRWLQLLNINPSTSNLDSYVLLPEKEFSGVSDIRWSADKFRVGLP